MKIADRQKIFNKYGGKCAYCGCDLEKGWHVDEINPIRRWVKNGEYNFIKKRYEVLEKGCMHPERLTVNNQNPSCASCNINKHSSSLEQFREMITHFIVTLNRDNTQYKIAKRYGLITETNIEVKFYFETITKEIVCNYLNSAAI